MKKWGRVPDIEAKDVIRGKAEKSNNWQNIADVRNERRECIKSELIKPIYRAYKTFNN
jgi:hypothetical protein